MAAALSSTVEKKVAVYMVSKERAIMERVSGIV
jgi:hypothetical protein